MCSVVVVHKFLPVVRMFVFCSLRSLFLQTMQSFCLLLLSLRSYSVQMGNPATGKPKSSSLKRPTSAMQALNSAKAKYMRSLRLGSPEVSGADMVVCRATAATEERSRGRRKSNRRTFVPTCLVDRRLIDWHRALVYCLSRCHHILNPSEI